MLHLPPGCDGGDETAAMTYVRDFGMRSPNMRNGNLDFLASASRGRLAGLLAVEFNFISSLLGGFSFELQEG